MYKLKIFTDLPGRFQPAWFISPGNCIQPIKKYSEFYFTPPVLPITGTGHLISTFSWIDLVINRTAVRAGDEEP
jgi:hypothetical protein